MAKKLYEEASVQDIAAAIREKNGATTKYKIAEMGAAVRAISGGGSTDLSAVGVYIADFQSSDELSITIGAVDKYTRLAVS